MNIVYLEGTLYINSLMSYPVKVTVSQEIFQTINRDVPEPHIYWEEAEDI
jgi:hypothetical protein